MKSTLKEKAVILRKRGMSYSDILSQVPVAKSTLSLWLGSVGLSRKQKQRLTERRLAAARRGAFAKKSQREKRQRELISNAEAEIGNLTKRELLLIGTALYWAEGSKQKEHDVSIGVDFSNSDLSMASVYLLWLKNILHLPKSRIRIDIYLHESARSRARAVVKYWARGLGIPTKLISSVYFKKHSLSSTVRRKTGNTYYGQIRIKIYKSTDLNRTIAGWVKGIVENCRVV